MKKLILTLSLAVASYFSYAQNTFPTNADAGIGTDYKLKIGYGLALPSYIKPVWNDNSNTGLQIHTFAGGADITAMSFSPTTGNIGIGTTTPLNSLSVITAGASIKLGNTTANRGIYFGIDGTGEPAIQGIVENSDIPRQLSINSAGGNVGIGTTSPLENLSVIAPTNSTNQIGFGVTGEQKSALYHTNADGLLIYSSIITNANHPFHFLTGGVTADERLTILGNGNMGVGTRNPNQKLEVAGNVAITGTNGLILNTSGGGAIDNQTASLFLQKENGYPIIFRNTSPTYTEYMRINPAGNVGIGTQNPGEKLTVNGTIHSKEVKVDINIPVPDYVFDPDYKLPGLNDVKAYVEKNHHLPEIPSAIEIEKKGISLGEMNMKLLKKVEELTLYLIEKDQQVNALQEDLIKLKKQMASINKK